MVAGIWREIMGETADLLATQPPGRDGPVPGTGGPWAADRKDAVMSETYPDQPQREPEGPEQEERAEPEQPEPEPEPEPAQEEPES